MGHHKRRRYVPPPTIRAAATLPALPTAIAAPAAAIAAAIFTAIRTWPLSALSTTAAAIPTG